MKTNPTRKLLESLAELREQGIPFMPLSKLKPWPGNPNRHDPGTPRLVRNMQRFGWTQPAIIRRDADGDGSHEVSAGHGRAFEAAVALGLEDIPVIFRNFTAHESHAYGLADNKAPEFSHEDEGALKDVIDELIANDGLQDVLDAGYDMDELLELGSIPELPDERDAPDSNGSVDGEGSTPDNGADDKQPEKVEAVTRAGDDIAVGRHRIVCGDCLSVLKSLPDCSVDSIVTDPPYGLSPDGKARTWDDLAADEKKRAGFMGKAWDAGVPGVTWAAECLRVLKPGGHLIAFSATRTIHRLTSAVEDAGFEIRDMISWLQWQGFPKSMDVSKAIDKQRDDIDDVRKVCRWLRAAMESAGMTAGQVAKTFDMHSRMVDHWAARDTDSQPTLPTLTQWDELRELLSFGDEMDAEVYRLNMRKGEPGEAWKDRPVTGQVDEWKDRVNYAITSRDGMRRDTPMTDAAKQWDGWGTGLKPAQEPAILARKPLSGSTVAANVLEHGTGGINIDGCRIADGDTAWPGPQGAWDVPNPPNDEGRFPANIYACPKPARSEKQDGAAGEGNIHPTVKPVRLMRWLVRLVTPPGGTVLEPFLGSGTTLVACEREGFAGIGVEMSPEYMDIALARVRKAVTDS